MALAMSMRLRNARLDTIETVLGASPIMRIFAGTMPVNCAGSDGANTVLATVNLPADFMGPAASAQKSMLGTWTDISCDASGTISYWRIFDNGGINCDLQGSAGLAGSGADMITDAAAVTAGQYFTVVTFVLAEANQ